MISVIDLKICNIASVLRALDTLGLENKVVDDPKDIGQPDKLILPGVGNFFEASNRMRSLGWDLLLREKVLEEKVPILGICLGMQLFASYGEEGGQSKGLDFINAKVSYLRSSHENLRVPHVGWNDVSRCDMPIFDSLEGDNCFYFVHSYEMIIQESVQAAYSNYGVDIVAAVQKDNIVGVQFHPEKSQKAGLTLLQNFARRM